MNDIKAFFDLFTPRFMMEWAVVDCLDDGSFSPIFPVNQLTEHDNYEYTHMVKLSFFNLFGYPIFIKVCGSPEKLNLIKARSL